MRSHWLARIETLGTTAVVLMVGSMMVWYESVERGGRLALVIGSAVSLYVAALVVLGRRSPPTRISWWPFASPAWYAAPSPNSSTPTFW